jgi:hypothetical protein
MSLFDPNVRFERPPKRPAQVRRMIISWIFTAIIVGLLAASIFIGFPAWVSTILILAVLAAMTLITRRWR